MDPCCEYSVSLFCYLDNELRGQEFEAFSNHLSGCASCSARLAEEQALSRLLRQTGALYSAPEEVRERVLAAAARAESGRKRKLPCELVLDFLRSLCASLRHALEEKEWRLRFR